MKIKSKTRPKRQNFDKKEKNVSANTEKNNILEFVQKNDHIFETEVHNQGVESYDFEQAKKQKENELKKRRAHRENLKLEQKKQRDAYNKKYAMFTIGGIIAVLLVFTLYTASVKFMTNNVSTVTETVSFEIEASEKSVTAPFNGGVLVSDRGKIICYDKDAREVLSYDAVSASPVIKTSGKSAVVAYLSTQNAYVITDGRVNQITAPDVISGASVSDNGISAVICSEEGYRGQVIVYDDNMTEIYRWHSATAHITDVAVSPDGKGMAVSTLKFDDGGAVTEAVFLDFKQSTPYAQYQMPDTICANIKYLSKSRIALIGDSKTHIINKKGKLINEISYKSMKPTTFDIDNDGNIVMCFKHDDSILSQCDVVTFNRNGKEKGRYTANSAVKAVSINNGKVLAVPERHIVLVSESGSEIFSGEINKDIKQAILLDDLTNAVVVSGTTAQYIELK